MRNRDPKPLALALILSAILHGGFLRMAPPAPRPAEGPRNREPRLALVKIPLPSPPREAIPPQEPSRPRPVPAENPALPAPAAPAETTPAENPGEPPNETVFPGAPAGDFFDPALRENAINSYLGMVRGLIDQRKEYPYQSRRQEQEGTVLIRFTLSRQGLLLGEPVMEKRSRYERLNTSALEAVKNAAPYPPFPGEIGEGELTFQVTVAFSLK